MSLDSSQVVSREQFFKNNAGYLDYDYKLQKLENQKDGSLAAIVMGVVVAAFFGGMCYPIFTPSLWHHFSSLSTCGKFFSVWSIVMTGMSGLLAVGGVVQFAISSVKKRKYLKENMDQETYNRIIKSIYNQATELETQQQNKAQQVQTEVQRLRGGARWLQAQAPERQLEMFV